MSNQSAVLISTFQAIGLDIKTLLARQGNLATLDTTAKNNLVAALNEVRSMIGEGGAPIDDNNVTAITTYSSQKIVSVVDAAITSLIGGASVDYNTLGKIATAIGDLENEMAGLAGAVRFDITQTLTEPQQLQASTNIGVGDPSTDFLDVYETAKE